MNLYKYRRFVLGSPVIRGGDEKDNNIYEEWTIKRNFSKLQNRLIISLTSVQSTDSRKPNETDQLVIRRAFNPSHSALAVVAQFYSIRNRLSTRHILSI